MPHVAACEGTAHAHAARLPQAGPDGSRGLADLPGAIMVNREPLDMGVWPDVGPYRLTRAVLAAGYGLLQVGGFMV